ncbi:uncharacterized protein I206_107750 [Kwoniella pini CBS 10737]|uniref:Uncharacterized protein n=1 Tax=Kwoniella pini CBS 10737 TaxID=1296096 RepID=A0A1B9HY61_9TREE|nr:uncharacterized protein I206_06083 [Kwoniella pini CBS 10737]OCF48215.1 hypothetical protein I206_06083 [Kwoniella pini CBS 10737]
MSLPPLSNATKQALLKLGITYPIIQAPMAGVSTPLLAATITNNGGLGSLGLGASNHLIAEKMIIDTQKLINIKNGKFNVNLFVHSKPNFDSTINSKWLNQLKPEFEKYKTELPKELKIIYKSFEEDENMLKILLKLKPPIISFHFGLPSFEILYKLKEIGSILMITVTNLKEALEVQNKGGNGLIDFIIVQGYEAGGHRGIFNPNENDEKLSTFKLCKLILNEKKINIPIISTGGIMNGKLIKKYLNLGCSAVQLGTTFIGCKESSIDKGYKEFLFNIEKSKKTIMTKFISGRPARTIENKFTDLEIQLRLQNVDVRLPDYPITYDAGKALHNAAKQFDEYGYGAYWAGENAPLARKLDAKEMLETLVKEWKDAERDTN